MKTTIIYVLRDPRTMEVRYVGKTVCKLKARLSSHMHDSKTKKSHRGRWIASLTKINLKPIIEEIDRAGEDWADRERYWISFYRETTGNLTNECDGGEGVAGVVRSPEWRAKKSAEVKVVSNSREWQDRMVASRQDFWTEARRAERSAKVKAEMTPERIAKHSEKVRTTMADPEWKAAHSVREKAKWTPEMRAAQAERTRIQYEKRRISPMDIQE